MMKPIEFAEMNVQIAEHQDEYLTLPAYQDDTVTVSCWELSLRERLKVLVLGKIWFQQMHFGGMLQPQLPQVEYPFIKK
jgi:hypothetical protein